MQTLRWSRWGAVALALAAACGTVGAREQAVSEDDYVTRYKAYAEQRGMTLTPQQEEALRAQYRQVQAQVPMQIQMLRDLLAGRGAQGLAASAAPAVAPAAVSPAGAAVVDLAAQVERLPPPAHAEVVTKRDGFELNGRRIIDPQGRIARFSASPRTGDYIYMITLPDGSQVAKRGRGEGTAFPLANVRGAPGAWAVQAVDGQSMQVEALTLTPLGVIGTREGSVFELEAGKAIVAHALPDGWSPVPLQRGDVSATRHLLLERNADSRPQEGSLAGLLQMGKRLTGVQTADDYALLNLDTGRLTILAIDASGKSVARMSDCRRKNAVVNICNRAESVESLWNTDGSKNNSHYYWRVNWMDTPDGPIAVALQHSVKEIRLFDLNRGKEVVAFRRPMGIADWMVMPTRDGRVGVAASWAFQNFVLDDARRLLNEGEDVKGRELSGTVVAGVAEGGQAASSAAQ